MVYENEAGDSIVFDNRTANVTDFVQASMDGPVTVATKYYPCKVYGSINKTTGAGEIYMDTQFGAMGNVYFTFTSSAKAAKEE